MVRLGHSSKDLGFAPTHMSLQSTWLSSKYKQLQCQLKTPTNTNHQFDNDLSKNSRITRYTHLSFPLSTICCRRFLSTIAALVWHWNQGWWSVWTHCELRTIVDSGKCRTELPYVSDLQSFWNWCVSISLSNASFATTLHVRRSSNVWSNPACVASTFVATRFSCPNPLQVAIMFDRFDRFDSVFQRCLYIAQLMSGSTRSTPLTWLTSQPLSSWAAQQSDYPHWKLGRW